MFPVIDAHVHLYPPEVSADPESWGARQNELYWTELVSGTEEQPSLQGWADGPKLLEDMEAAGVSGALLLGWYWENQQTCGMQNRWYADWASKHPSQIRWFATVQPQSGKRALNEMRIAAAKGACGLGELSPAAQGFSVRDKDFRKIVELALEFNWPINFHVNEALGRDHAGRKVDALADFQWLASNYPELKIILAHWGGLIPFFELNKAVRRDLRNVYYDTAASPLLYDPRIYRAVVDLVGPEKVIFGSDYPLRLYPRKESVPGFESILNEIRSSGLTDAELQLILHDNIERLLVARSD